MVSIAKVILGVIVSFFIIAIIVSFIVYNYMQINVVNFCISGTLKDSSIPCNNTSFCKSLINENIKNFSNIDISSKIKSDVNYIFNKSVFCENTCKVKDVSILNSIIEIENIPKSNTCEGENISITMTPKEIINLLKKLKK